MVEYCERVEGEGWTAEVVVGDREGKVVLKGFALAREVYGEAVKRGGMDGRLEWREVRLQDVPRPALIFSADTPTGDFPPLIAHSPGGWASDYIHQIFCQSHYTLDAIQLMG